MSLVETQAQETAFTYNISPNGACGDWYWEVMCSGDIVARGLAPTKPQARAGAIKAAASHIERQSEVPTLPLECLRLKLS